jgi:hypothetical protein
MTKYAYITRKRVTSEYFDRCINDLLKGRYERANQRYNRISEILKEKVENCRTQINTFQNHYWVAGLGQGLSDALVERTGQVQERDISDIAKEAKNFYDAFLLIGEAYPNISVPRYDAYRNLGRSYVALGLETEGIRLLEQLREPRFRDMCKLRQKVEELAGEK